jgi:NAD(P)-dependent dehydrogenase (short-subunit alcohol dehydrogenase family)
VPEGHWLNELLTAAQYGYRMSKAALNCGGATMARDLKGDGIAVALIHPGAVSCPVKFNLIFSNQGENADMRNSASAKGRRKGCLEGPIL